MAADSRRGPLPVGRRRRRIQASCRLAAAQGLKFGIHIVRGIPRQVVAANLPIAGTHFHASDAADTTSPCPWDEGNWGVKDNAAGQAYYDSMMRLYADGAWISSRSIASPIILIAPRRFARSPMPSARPGGRSC